MSRLSQLEVELRAVEREIDRVHWPLRATPDRAALYARRRELQREIAMERRGVTCPWCGALNHYPVAVGGRCRLCGEVAA